MQEMFQDEQPAQPAQHTTKHNVRVSSAFHSPACLIRVKVVPGSRRDQVVGALGDELKLKVAAAPEDGAANTRVCALLASRLLVAARDVTIVAGLTQAHKVVRVQGIAAATARHKLLEASAGVHEE